MDYGRFTTSFELWTRWPSRSTLTTNMPLGRPVMSTSLSVSSTDCTAGFAARQVGWAILSGFFFMASPLISRKALFPGGAAIVGAMVGRCMVPVVRIGFRQIRIGQKSKQGN